MFFSSLYKRSSPALMGLLGFIALSQAVQAQTPASNILQNGSAEDGTDKTVTGWNFTAGDVTADDLNYGIGSEASEGKQSFHISLLKPVQANVWFSQELTVPADAKSFQISCSAKSKTDTTRTAYAVPAISCYFLDGKHTWIQWQELENISESTDWRAYKRNVAIPVGATVIGIRLGVQSKGVIETYFDDVKVIPSTTYLNMVDNGDLESDSGPSVRGWTFQKQAGNDQQLSYTYSTKAAQGKQALRIEALDDNAEVHGYWSQTIATAPGIANYQISLRGKLGDAAAAKQADATVNYAYLDENRRPLGQMAFGLIVGTQWNDYSAVVSPPAGAKFIEIRLGLDGTGKTEALFDDIKLTPSP